MTPAIYSRRMQFIAGPNTTVFYACEEHKAELESNGGNCHYPIASEPIHTHSPDDELECDFCREGGSE